MHELTELQRDTLMETFNIGVGRASRALSQLLACEMALSVPRLEMALVKDMSSLLKLPMDPNESCAVSRRMSGIDAEVLMLFHGEKSTISSLINNQLDPDQDSDPRENVVSKIAYLVTESCFDQISDVINKNVARAAPVYMATVPPSYFIEHRDPLDTLIIVKIDISLKKKDVSGHLLLSFTSKGANELAVGLDRMIEESAED